ncbi:hypothetical protein [Pseudonocardia sp.]|uniref:hypothetical protein n=1 Tax=Pseudonocardia sp. TaxID=60912 RepID=UPI003D1460D3
MTTAERTHPVLQRWPAALGVGCAVALLALGADRETVATCVIAAAICYLAAAALGRPWVAWAAIPATFVVGAIGAPFGAPPWLSIAMSGVLLLVAGLVGQASRVALRAQTGALLVYGAAAVLGLLVSPAVGLVIVGLTLAAHGIWDVIHLRSGEVVPRSLAEACIALDVPLGLGVIALAVLA